jgi:hypothetical protein
MKCAAGPIPESKVCTRAPESGDMTIGALKADGVTYTYFQKRLYRIDILVKTDEVASQIGAVLNQVYGPGVLDPADGHQGWKGDQTQISWGRTLRTPGGTLTYQFLPLLEDVEIARVKAGGEGLADIAKEI